MKHGRWMALVVVMVMLVTPLAVFAQGDDEWKLVEYVSEDELLTAELPEEWVSGQMEDYPFPHVVSAATQDTFDWMTTSEGDDDNSPRTGDKALLATILPLDFVALMGVELPEEMDIAFLTETLSSAFLGDSEEAEFGEVEEVDLGDNMTAGLVTAKDAEGEGVFIVRDLGEDLVLLMYVIAAPGEYTDDLTVLGKQVAATVEYTGAADDLIALMMGEVSGDTSTDGALDGEALVSERCSMCHSTERIDKADKDEAGWTETVDEMIGKGAQLTAEERDAVIAYLVETH